MALRSLASVIPRWNAWAKRASGDEVLSGAAYSFPTASLQLAGSVIQRYRLYRRPTVANPQGDSTGPFKIWIDRVSSSMENDFVPALRNAGFTLPDSIYADAGVKQDRVIGHIQEFNSLLQKVRSTGFRCTP